MKKESLHPLDLVIKERIVLSNPRRLNLTPTETFIDHIKADTHTFLNLPGYGEVGLVQKKRPYTNNQTDMMLMPFYRHVSLITECEPKELKSLFTLANHTCSVLSNLEPNGFPVIAINQQQDCHKVVSDKVQTIDRLHFHLFIENNEGVNKTSIRQLDKIDKNDFLDPFTFMFTDYFKTIVEKEIKNKNLKWETSVNWNNFPLGLKINTKLNLEELCQSDDFCSLIKNSQQKYFDQYSEIAKCLLQDPNNPDLLIPKNNRIENINNFIKDNSIDSRVIRKTLLVLAKNLKNTQEESRKHLKFVTGSALTWIIYQQGDFATINVSPRIISKGNAMESFGIWKDQFEDASQENQMEYNQFYSNLVSNINQIYCPQSGPLLNLYSHA